MKVQDKRNIRRQSAVSRLEEQLKKGTKPNKETNTNVSLEDKDKERIKKEIVTLKNKILLN